jgi:hypothetical protein
MKNSSRNKTIKNRLINTAGNSSDKAQNFAGDIFQALSSNKLLIGIVAIFVNIGSRYIPINLTKNQEALLKNISTELLIFAITLLMSRDIVTAIVLTAAFTVIVRYILNENSQFCVLPQEYRSMTDLVDTNKDGFVTEDELENAKQILAKYKDQQHLYNKIFMLNNFQ